MYRKEKTKLAAMKPFFGLFGKKLMPETNLVKGEGSISKAGEIVKKRNIDNVLVITDAILLELGLLKPMFDSLDASNIKYSIYSDVKPDPTFTIVEEAMKVCQDNSCQGIIAFGGGSVLDTAKTVAASAANGFKDPRKFEGMMKVRKKPLPFIAIPTTAGTGSEVTIVAVVSDPVSHRKTTIVDPKLIATDTILDPAITVGLPKHITSTTGLDALTHAVEAYVSGFANDHTDKMALKAIKLITENLVTAYNTPTDMEARENLLVGSMFAGQAFTRTYIGYVHAFSHNIGGKYGVPHGLGNAVILPYVMEDAKVIEATNKRFAELSDFLELTGKQESTSVKADAFISYLFELNKQLDIPERLEAFPESGIDEIIDGAFAEAHGNYPVPRYYSREEAREVLQKVCAK
ncbi:iron-containing alcohol dehydrogenase [Mollicutes bacterium LVI A0039]|nr:iron-containing alcohol dehydrogenase [Mollicutes bacterium LVI A0039]